MSQPKLRLYRTGKQRSVTLVDVLAQRVSLFELFVTHSTPVVMKATCWVTPAALWNCASQLVHAYDITLTTWDHIYKSVIKKWCVTTALEY